MFDSDAERYRAFAEAAFEGLLFHQDGKVVDANAQFAQMFGYAPDELAGRDIYDLVAEPSAATVREHVAREDVSVYAALGRHRDGRTFPIRISARNVTLNGQTARVAAVRDITEDHEARVVLERARKRLHRSLLQTVSALSRMMEARDAYTYGHQSRTAELAVAMARQLGLGEMQVHAINLGATIHDIGKVGLPSAILNKPDALDEAERALIRTHARRGYEIVKELDLRPAVPDVVLHHHERLDGSGYPDGLRGGDVSREVRIVAVADVLEAMTSHRPYRPGRPAEKVLALLQDEAGVRFDADAVAAAAEVLAAGEVRIGA